MQHQKNQQQQPPRNLSVENSLTVKSTWFGEEFLAFYIVHQAKKKKHTQKNNPPQTIGERKKKMKQICAWLNSNMQLKWWMSWCQRLSLKKAAGIRAALKINCQITFCSQISDSPSVQFWKQVTPHKYATNSQKTQPRDGKKKNQVWMDHGPHPSCILGMWLYLQKKAAQCCLSHTKLL